MTRPGPAALALLAALLPAPAHAQPAGEKYAPRDGGFAVRFPGTPKETAQAARSPLGELTVVTATYVTAEGNVYLVSYTDFPLDDGPKDARTALLDGVREGLKKDGTVLSDDEVKDLPDGVVGRDLELKKGAQRVRVRVLLRGGRVYQVGAVGSEVFATGKAVKGFIESFELTK
jgi:hypothetical protein